MGKYDSWDDFFEQLSGDRHVFDLDRFEGETGVELPPSARRHAAWWSSAQYFAKWADHGWRATPRLMSNEVVFERAPSRAATPSAAPSGPGQLPGVDVDLILVGCVKTKGPVAAPAKDLYTSALWVKRRRYAEATGKPWAILSAEHGLVDPDEVIEPYDRYLGSEPAEYRARWSQTTADAVIDKCRQIGASSVEIHAGKAYFGSGLEEHLRQAGIEILVPLRHYRQGEQLAWYDGRPSDSDRVATAPPVEPAQEQAEAFTEQAIAILKTAIGDLSDLVAGRVRAAVDRPGKESLEPETKGAVAAALLTHGVALQQEGNELPEPVFTPNEPANRFFVGDPFAFLVAVVCDYQIKAERAWEAPYLLAERLGGWGPEELAARSQDVVDAFRMPPSLHRFPERTAGWVVDAARIVLDEYGGEAAAIWGDTPRAAELQERLRAFPGISQKKAAMAVEILERDLGVPIADLHGSDIAYDVHVRRVFLRSGLADRDEVAHMVEVARRLHPERPGALDNPAWDIGRRWCRSVDPLCDLCAIGDVCPRVVDRAAGVTGA